MAETGNNLKAYHSKRDFRQSSEPQDERPSTQGERPRFVIQLHDASTLHYDFRLEVDGVLKSWAVPKGPSTDPRDKRLAVPTEDHPLDYADFEGVIPEGQYGAGAVLVWDRGAYCNMTRNNDQEVPIAKAIDDGHVVVSLKGEKLQGGYALTRIDPGDDEQWLLVKVDDQHADARRNPTSTQRESVRSGRTIEELTDDAQEND